MLVKFLIGVFLLEFISVILFILFADNLTGIGWVKLAVPLVLIGMLAAFWFQSVAESGVERKLSKLKEQFAKEREKIKVNAERAKTRVVKDAQKQIATEASRTHAKANFKVGAAFAGVVGIGGLLLLTEVMLLGLLTLTTAGGALGGYLYRAKRDISLPFTSSKTSKSNSLPKQNKIKVIQGKSDHAN